MWEQYDAITGEGRRRYVNALQGLNSANVVPFVSAIRSLDGPRSLRLVCTCCHSKCLPSADTDPCSHIGEVLIVDTFEAGSPVEAKASVICLTLVLTYITMWTTMMDVMFDTQSCASERVMMYARNTERDINALQSARQRQRHG